MISVLQGLWIAGGDKIPTALQAAVGWDVVTLWFRSPEDEGRTFEQDVMLFAPDGTMSSHTKLQFSMTLPFHRTVSHVFGFPVGQAGQYSLELKLKDMKDEATFIQHHTYPLLLSHREKPETTSA
jgi:hypothetical protein